MLKTFAVALLATAMSVGLAEAKGRGPAKNVCQKGQWCHAFVSACTQ
jgi:hypothetical protein